MSAVARPKCQNVAAGACSGTGCRGVQCSVSRVGALGSAATGTGRGGLAGAAASGRAGCTPATSSNPSSRATCSAAWPMSSPLMAAYRLTRSPPLWSPPKSIHCPALAPPSATLSEGDFSDLHTLCTTYSPASTLPPGSQASSNWSMRLSSASASSRNLIGGRARGVLPPVGGVAMA